MYLEDDEEFDLNKLFDDYYLEKGQKPPLAESRTFRSVQVHLIRGSRYLVTVDEETIGSQTSSMISILLKSGNAFKVKSRFSVRAAG